MSESKSSSISLDVFSSQRRNSKVVYPYRIVRPLGKNSAINEKKQFELFLNDILENTECKIDHFVADNLKRASIKGCLCHSVAFPCEYCYSRGVPSKKSDNSMTQKNLILLKKKIKALSDREESNAQAFDALEAQLKKTEKDLKNPNRSHLVWPASTRNGESRTHENVLEIVNKIERQGPLTPEEAKGIKERSPLFKIPNFDIVRDSPAEYLHSVCLGTTKRITILTFNVGDNKQNKCNASQFNKLMESVKSTREFSRRIRELDFSVMKAQKYRNLQLFFFPIIIECLGPAKKLKKLWLLLTYIIRAAIIPTPEFRLLDLNVIEEAAKQFYELYEHLFGQNKCAYCIHVVASHIMEIRAHGPLTLTSAFGFEAFYGEIRQSFTPGSPSTLKQIFQKILLKRSLSYHCCQNSIYYAVKETPLECNNMIYVFQDGTHKMYKIIEVSENSVLCLKQGKYPAVFPELPHLNWGQIGIYKKGALSRETTTMMKKDISGKVLNVNNLLITCPNNILREK